MQDHRLVLCQVAHVQGKTLEFQMAAVVVTKQFAVQILICFVFSSVQFIFVCCFWRTHTFRKLPAGTRVPGHVHPLARDLG